MRTQLEVAAGPCYPVDCAVLVRVVMNGDDELGWGGVQGAAECGGLKNQHGRDGRSAYTSGL